MEEIKTKAVVLAGKDFQEADKIMTLFTVDYGKVACKFNGVRKAKAKLKALIQPFTLIEVECFKRADFFTAKTGVVLDCYPKITADFKKTICAYIVVEIIDKILIKNKPEPEIFLNLLDCLTKIEEGDCYQATINFIQQFFNALGEKLINDIDSQRIYLDLDMANFSDSRTANSIEIDKKCYKALSCKEEQENVNKMCLKMLNNVFRAKYDIEINSFSFL